MSRFRCVRLESEELNDATVIVSTGLACERTHNKSPGYGLDVTCKGDPRADVGDTVPVIVDQSQGLSPKSAISMIAVSVLCGSDHPNAACLQL
jgi:hypothetical protein